MNTLVVVTSFIYTEVYVTQKKALIERIFFKNIEFQKKITNTLNYFLKKYEISFITLFLGPSPLISCRTTLIFFQGVYLTKKIPFIEIKGNLYYKYDFYDYVIIQNFSEKYTLIEKKIEEPLIDIKELEKINFIHKKVGIVSREAHSIAINNNYNVILFPNHKLIIKNAFKKYNEGKLVKKVSQIKPYY